MQHLGARHEATSTRFGRMADGGIRYGWIGAIASIDAASFYATLNTPPWARVCLGSHLGGLARQPERFVAAGQMGDLFSRAPLRLG